MTESEFEVLLAEMRAGFRDLHALIEERLPAAPRPAEERPDDLVDVKYVARKLGLAVYTVRQGKAGTNQINWLGRRPLRTTRREVERFIRERAEACEPPHKRVLKLLDRSRSRRKRTPRV